MFYEMRKFYKNKAVLICFCLALVLSVLMPVLFTCQYSSSDYSTGKEVEISGLKAVKYEKKQSEKVSGTLSTEKLNKALSFYKKHLDKNQPNKVCMEMDYKYPSLYSLLSEAYTPFGMTSIDLTTIADADDFYEQSVNRINEEIQMTNYESISAAEKSEILKKAADISKPYKLEFVNQWSFLIKALFVVYIVIVLSAFLISSNLFSFEKENNMEIILNSVGKKKLVSIGIKKNLAMAAYLSVEFILCTVISTAIVLMICGVSGWNSQIQILSQFNNVIYNWTIGQMLINFFIIAWLCILSMACIGSLINSIVQQTYTSLIISLILIIVPVFLRNSTVIPAAILRYINVQPINGITPLYFIDKLFVYNLAGYKVLGAVIITVIAAVYIIAANIISPVIFSIRINNSGILGK